MFFISHVVHPTSEKRYWGSTAYAETGFLPLYQTPLPLSQRSHIVGLCPVSERAKLF
jgi:hypothetical protein